MQKLIETLRELGIDVPAEKETEVRKKISEGYKNVAEYNKALKKIEEERDNYKSQAETAAETLKGFEGIDPEELNNEIAKWKKAAEDAQKDYETKLFQRDFADTLDAELGKVKFTSEAAKKAIVDEIKGAGLTMKDGKILGLNDLMEQIKAKDASAFVTEEQQRLEEERARFTQSLGGGNESGKSKLAKMSLDERIKLKATDPALYENLKKS